MFVSHIVIKLVHKEFCKMCCIYTTVCRVVHRRSQQLQFLPKKCQKQLKPNIHAGWRVSHCDDPQMTHTFLTDAKLTNLKHIANMTHNKRKYTEDASYFIQGPICKVILYLSTGYTCKAQLGVQKRSELCIGWSNACG